MDGALDCHLCGLPQCPWSIARCSSSSPQATCREIFCFTCLSAEFPEVYNTVFKELCWICPSCLSLCSCNICQDQARKTTQHIKRAKQDFLLRKWYSEAEPMELETATQQSRVVLRECKEVRNLKYDAWNREPVGTPSKRDLNSSNELDKCLVNSPMEPLKTTIDLVQSSDSVQNDMWECPKCSVPNMSDALDCLACCFHRKRTRRRISDHVKGSSDHVREDKHDVKPKELMVSHECPPHQTDLQEGEYHLRDLVRQPWLDDWKTARSLAVDLVEEAKSLAVFLDVPVREMRQLPTKSQLMDPDVHHVRRWYDREPTLAKKFLRACGLVSLKSNGTYIDEHVLNLDELLSLVHTGDPTRGAHNASDSENEAPVDDSKRKLGKATLNRPPFLEYTPKLKAYWHRPDQSNPFIFKVPFLDLHSLDELYARVAHVLAHEPAFSARRWRINHELDGKRRPVESWDDIKSASRIHIQQTSTL